MLENLARAARPRPYLAVLGILALATLAAVILWPRPAFGEASCDPARPQAAGDFNLTIDSGGLTREYMLHVPPSYTGADPVPLMLNLHGYTSTAIAQLYYSELGDRADQPEGGFIVVQPEGLTKIPENPAAQHWNHVQFGGLQDDGAFLSDLLDEMEATLCIDADRIFSTGMSNGGEMSIRLACSLSSRFAAIAPVAGAYYPRFTLMEPPAPWQDSAETCPDTRPVPVITFHGTLDTAVPFEGGLDEGGFDYRLAIDNTTPEEDDVMQSWAAHNGCTSGRQESTVTSEVRFVTYTGCNDGAEVQLYIVDGGGHTWPGAAPIPWLGYTTQDISATDLMLEFFEAHPMPGASEPKLPPPGDIDGDGCTNRQENGPDPQSGGERDYLSFWDLYDVWTRPDPVGDPDGWVRNGSIDLFGDIFGVANRFGANDDNGNAPLNRNSDPLVPPAADNKTGYHPVFDRGALIGPDPWDMGPADGSIDLFIDIFGVANQFGHDCT